MSVSFLKMRSAVPSPGNHPVAIPVTSRSEFALAPLCEEGAKTDDSGAIRSWEGEFESISAFYQSRKGQNMPMPAVSVVHSAMQYASANCNHKSFTELLVCQDSHVHHHN